MQTIPNLLSVSILVNLLESKPTCLSSNSMPDRLRYAGHQLLIRAQIFESDVLCMPKRRKMVHVGKQIFSTQRNSLEKCLICIQKL